MRLGQPYPGKTTWGKAHIAWLASRKLAHLEQRIALEEMLHAVRQASERIGRLEQAMRAAMPRWSLAPLAAALPAVRGIALKAQTRLSARYRALRRAGKLDVIAITAVARELAAFVRAVGRAVGCADSVPLV